jgi:hypothetical protein
MEFADILELKEHLCLKKIMAALLCICHIDGENYGPHDNHATA